MPSDDDRVRRAEVTLLHALLASPAGMLVLRQLSQPDQRVLERLQELGIVQPVSDNPGALDN
jgi:hypothetical protein